MIFLEENNEEAAAQRKPKWNATNTTIYYFSKDGRKHTSFTAWVDAAGVIVNVTDKYKQLLNEHIDTAQELYKTKGWSIEPIC